MWGKMLDVGAFAESSSSITRFDLTPPRLCLKCVLFGQKHERFEEHAYLTSWLLPKEV